MHAYCIVWRVYMYKQNEDVTAKCRKEMAVKLLMNSGA